MFPVAVKLLMTRVPRVLTLLWFVVGWNAAGQEQKARPEIPPAVRPVVDLARSAPPEFFADIIVRLVETGRIPARELQVDLLTEAFGAAAQVQQPFRWIGIPNAPADNRPYYLARAGELKLDALSLESRVLKAMLTVDPAKARELFQSVPHPLLDPRPCEDPLIADVSAYYEVAGALAQSSFSADEKEKGQHLQFLLTALAGARSPGEMAAFARSLGSVAWSPPQLEMLLASLGAKLQSLGSDYRPFAVSVSALRQELEGLSRQAQALGVSTDALAQGVRAYLVTQLTAPRCAEDLGDTTGAVAWFNGDFRGALSPISGEETKPSKRNGTVKVDPYYDSAEAKQLAAEFTRLRATATAGLAKTDMRSSPEWRRLLTDLLRDASAWQPSGSVIDAFHQKANVMLGIYQRAPPGDDRDRILSMYLTFLESASAEQQNPAEWLWQVRLLVMSAGPDAPKLAHAFEASSDMGLNLYPAMTPGP